MEKFFFQPLTCQNIPGSVWLDISSNGSHNSLTKSLKASWFWFNRWNAINQALTTFYLQIYCTILLVDILAQMKFIIKLAIQYLVIFLNPHFFVCHPPKTNPNWNSPEMPTSRIVNIKWWSIYSHPNITVKEIEKS